LNKVNNLNIEFIYEEYFNFRICENSSTYCIECAIGYYRKSFWTNECYKDLPGYYLWNNFWYKCERSCSTCETTTSNCITCATGYYPEIGKKTPCYKEKYGWFISSNSWHKCDISCQTCETSATNCLICSNQYYRKKGTEKSCYKSLTGYYIDWNYYPYLWNDCNSSCNTCNSSTDCLTCEEGFYRKYNNAPLCYKTLPGWYLSSDKWNQCDITCKACDFQASNCLVCTDGYYPKTGTLSPCYNTLSGYYLNSNYWDQCDITCKTCQSSATNCKTCADGYYPISGKNSPCYKTLDGYYLNSNFWQLCDKTCKICEISYTNCLICSFGYYSKIGTKTPCYNSLSGYYLSSNNWLQCNSSCYTCEISATNCLKCNDSSSKLVKISDNNVNCLTDTAGYYLPTGSDIYLKCSSSCKTCTITNSNCSKCEDSLYLAENESYTTCIRQTTGYYLPSGSNIYLKCSSSCKTCTITNSNCSSCEDSLYLATKDTSKFYCIADITGYVSINSINSNYYLKCSDNCKTCLSQTFCTMCEENFYLIEVNNNLRSCLQNINLTEYYTISKNVYKRCSDKCLTCETSENNCTSCNLPSKLAESDYISSTITCISDFNGYYFNSHANYFKKCSSNCLTCETSEINCTTCSKNLFLGKNPLNFFCLEDTDGYYFDETLKYYEKCSISCLTCKENKSYCLICNNSQNYFAKINETQICILKDQSPDGYYFNSSSNLHEKCSINCLTCKDQFDNCIICNYSKFYFPKADEVNKCFHVENMPDGYFLNKTTKIIEKCPENCKTCNDLDNCIICNNYKNYFAKSDEINKCISHDKSPDGYFFNNSTKIHEKCDESCKTCIENSKKCLFCNIDKKYLYKLEDKINTCSMNCPIGYNNIADKGVCKNCSKNCKTCELHIDNCKTCESGLYLIESGIKNSTCSNKTEGFYLDKENNIYRKCDKSCKTCNDNSNNCLICNIEYLKKDGEEKGCFDKNNLKPGEFIDENESKIKKCDKSCKICKFKADICLECNEVNNYFEFREENESISNKIFKIH